MEPKSQIFAKVSARGEVLSRHLRPAPPPPGCVQEAYLAACGGGVCIVSEKRYVYLSYSMSKHADSVDSAVLARVRSGTEGHVWTPSDFLDLGSRAAVDKALSRHCQAGHIGRAGRGLYHVPKNHPILGQLGPDPRDLHDAIARMDNSQLFPTGAHAANALGLSDQIPMRPFLLTTGRSRRIRQGKGEILLRHVSPRFVSTKNPKSAQVILALRWLGRRFVDDDTVAKLRRNLSPKDRAALPTDAASAPAWIGAIFRRVASDDYGR